MTINTSENKPEVVLSQEKVDATLSQQKIDATIAQQPENKESIEEQENPNWRAFREARKRDRAETEEANRRTEEANRRAAEKAAEAEAIKAAMEAAFARGNAQQTQEYQYEESEDERIEKKVQAALAAREEAAERARRERELKEYPTRLAQAYPDFNAVISPDNLDYLEFHYPEIARPLARLPEGFDRWSDIYHAVKKFVPNNTTAKREAAKADANFAKPKSISSTGITQPGEAVSSARLTEERRAANWERMQRTMKGVG